MNTYYRKTQTGSILIESLICLVILAFGILALAELDGTMMQAGANAQSRNIAYLLAQEKIDDLRTYNQLSDGGQAWDPNVVNFTTRPFEHIDDMQGGSILWTDNVVIGGDQWRTTIVGNTEYNIRWTVSHFGFDEDDDDNVIEVFNLNDTAYKGVTMVVSWTNIDGSIENIELETNIAKLNTYAANLIASTGAATIAGPIVEYTPGVAPEIIRVGDGDYFLETTLPEPSLFKFNDTYFSSFETVTYSSNNIELRREEFFTLNCNCAYDDPPTGSGFPGGRVIWHPQHGETEDPTDIDSHIYFVNSFFHPDEGFHLEPFQTADSRIDFIGDPITKIVGIESDPDNKQFPLCQQCCQDHHDGKATYLNGLNFNDSVVDDDEVGDQAGEIALAGAYACNPGDDDPGGNNGQRANCLDPWRPAVDYNTITGDHNHYDKVGGLIDHTDTGQNDVYLETCRLKRVNGLLFVFQDWHMHGNTYVAAADDVFASDLNGGRLTDYRSYIVDYVRRVMTDANNLPLNYTNTTPTNPATSFTWPPNNNVTFPITTAFIARGIYMDYLDPDYSLARINADALVHPTTFLRNIPYYEINLTGLSDWSPACAQNDNTGPLTESNSTNCVTDYSITRAASAENIRRGEARLRSGADYDLSATLQLSNTGFTDGSANVVGQARDQGVPLLEPTSDAAFISYPTSDDFSYDAATVAYTVSIPGGADGILD